MSVCLMYDGEGKSAVATDALLGTLFGIYHTALETQVERPAAAM